MADHQANEDNTRSFVPITKGTTISHYKIIEKIGAGGMGEVYLAEDTKLNRKVALKFLPPHLCQDEDCRARFKREAQATAKLNHPNIVTIHEVSEYQGRPYFAMEHVEGRALRDIIKKNEFSISEVVDLAIGICEGLNKAHQAGIVHRDIKPSNIVIDTDGRPKLLDFGLAAIRGSEKLTISGSTLGTIGYMSPEQIEGKDIDRRSDLFSLGIVFYEMITGRAPFKGETEAATLNSVLNDNPEPLLRYKSSVSGELQRIISKLLEKDSEFRYQSAAEVISDLKKLKIDLKSETSRGQSIVSKRQPSIAVLPFIDMSAQKDQEYFCDGIAEEIINALTHVESLRVVARTSAFSFKGKDVDIGEIGRKLSVETLLEGSVRKSGNRLRITAQLINVTDGYHLWSEKYDRDMEDIFAIQDEISLAIVDKLKLKLLGKEKAAIVKHSTDDPEAFNLFLMGRYFSGKKTEIALKKSIECFGRAIERDSEFSLGYAGLGYSYLRLGLNDFVPRSDAYRDARVKAMKAIALDDSNSLAHALLAEVMMWGDWDWLGAEREFEQVLALNPSDAAGHHGYAHLLEILGRAQKSIEHMKRALQFEPLSIEYNNCLGQVLYHARRYDEAIEQLHKTIEMDSNFYEAHRWLARAYMEKGMFAQALEELEILGPLEEHQSGMRALIGYVHAATGKRDEAKKILQRLTSLSQQGKAHHYGLAIIHIRLGEKDRAFEALEKQIESRSGPTSMLKVDPILDNLRTDTRFKKLLSKMKLA